MEQQLWKEGSEVVGMVKLVKGLKGLQRSEGSRQRLGELSFLKSSSAVCKSSCRQIRVTSSPRRFVVGAITFQAFLTELTPFSL